MIEERDGLSAAFAHLISQMEPDQTLHLPLKLAARLVSLALSSGFAFLSLSHIPPALKATLKPEEAQWATEPARWYQALKKSCLMAHVPLESNPVVPLVLTADHRLYLYRYWDYEQRLKKALGSRLFQPPRRLGKKSQQFLNRLFSDTDDAQRQAVEKALQYALTILSGGPGTGKTHTIVAFLIACWLDNPQASIYLAAPTGKAAARMSEAIGLQMATFQTYLDEADRALLPLSFTAVPMTLHRLMRLKPLTFKPERQPCLLPPIDWLIIDEASMMDLALATRLFEALSTKTHVLLVGDSHQLHAVEAGSVFSELCDLAARLAEKNRHFSRLTYLKKNHRFGHESGIGKVAHAIEHHDQRTLRMLCGQTEGSFCVRPLPEWDTLLPALFEFYKPLARLSMETTLDLEAIFQETRRYKILSPTYHGPYGVDRINALIGHQMARETIGRSDVRYYPGQILMITRNERGSLYNGDIGVMVYVPGEGLRALFFKNHAQDYISLSPSLLPPHETAFAMTVHKTQGSEFDHIAFMLPPYAEKLLFKRLIYTGITRAKKTVALYTDPATFLRAIDGEDIRSCAVSDGFEDPQGVLPF